LCYNNPELKFRGIGRQTEGAVLLEEKEPMPER
jgi:hypothetical protein